LDVALLKKVVGAFPTTPRTAMYRDRRRVQLAQLQESVEYSPSRWQGHTLPGNGLVGLLADVSTRMSRGSKLYANARLEDPERSVRLVIWPRVYEEARAYIRD
jgi:hypothetical protein